LSLAPDQRQRVRLLARHNRSIGLLFLYAL
jgi:hypothetical protein